MSDQQHPQVTPEMTGRVAEQIIGTSIPAADEPAVAELWTDLLADMAALRKTDVGETEPALIYRAIDS